MRIVEFFAGSGGFSRGAEAAGLSVSVAYDNDPILSSSYSRNFPHTKLCLADVAELTGEAVEKDAGGPIDGVLGGPPCQGFSSMGKRSRDDPRRLLLGHFFRLVSELQPRFFVMENVVGLLQGSAREVLSAALALVEQDYDVSEPLLLDASEFGAATKRKRMFVVGVRKDLESPFSTDELNKLRKKPASVKDAIYDIQSLEPLRSDPKADRWLISSTKEPSSYAQRLRSETKQISGNMRTNHTPKVVARFDTIPAGGVDRVGRHPRLAWDGLCPTLRAGTGSDKGSFQSVRPIHPDEPRVITVREGARLQGFPDCHEFHPTIWHSFRMIGNSVSPIIGEALFTALLSSLGPKECT